MEETGLSLRTVQSLAAQGKIPGAAKLGGRWTFDLVKLRKWIADEEAAVVERAIWRPGIEGLNAACERALGIRSGTSWASPSRAGGVSPEASIDEAYERVLAQRLSGTRKRK